MDKSPFGFARPEDSPGFLLWQTTISWQRVLKKVLDPYGVAHAHFVLMAITLWLTETGQVPTQTALAQLSKLDKMTVSKGLKKLVALGYVHRTESPEDSRAKSVTLTGAGKALIQTLVPLIEQSDAEFFARIDQKALNRLLRQLG